MKNQALAVGFGLRIWHVLLGVNHEMEGTLQRGLGRIRTLAWRKIRRQHKAIRIPLYILGGIADVLGSAFWDTKDALHVGVRVGWMEGGHRHREYLARRELRRSLDGGKDHPGYQAAVNAIHADRPQRATAYGEYSDEFRIATGKGKPPARIRDVPELSGKPDLVPTALAVALEVAQNAQQETPSETQETIIASDTGWAPEVPRPIDLDAGTLNGNGAQRKDAHPGNNNIQETVQSRNGSTTMTSSTEFPSRGNGTIELTSTVALRELYKSTQGAMAAIQERLQALATDLQTDSDQYDQAIGWMTSEQFPGQTIPNAANVQDVMAQFAAAVAAAVTAADPVLAGLDKAHSDSVAEHSLLEEAVSSAPGGAAKSTASYAAQ